MLGVPTCFRKVVVDLWDLTKVMFRRWYIALPMLLVSVIGVLALTQSTRPDYSATGFLQMIPPANSNPDTTKPGWVHNPWTDLGINALAQAAMIKVEDKTVLDDLVRQGYTDNVTFSVDDRSPLLRIEAVGRTPAQATGTVRQLMNLLDQQVRTQQSQYGVAPADAITTLVLDDGTNVTVVTTKLKRVIIVAVGIGLLLTAATTIGVDALFGRRARPRLVASAPPWSTPEVMVRPKDRPKVVTDLHPAAPVSPPVIERPLVSAATNGAYSDRPIPVTYSRTDDTTLVVHVDRPKSGPPAATEDESRSAATDTTIVLPLSHSRWSRRDDRA
jgi:hypothetical protein